MKTSIKLLIGMGMILMIMGMVSATDINNLKMPDGWESIGGGSYHEIGDSPGAGSGRNMMIMEFNDANCGDFMQNNTEENYFIFKNADGSYNFTDWVLNKDEGCFEVVEIDGKQYFMLFTSNIDKDYSSDKNIYEIMLEFNKLNNLKPIAI